MEKKRINLALIIVATLIWMCDAEIALAAECGGIPFQNLLNLFLLASVGLKGLSWVIGAIAQKTETKWDNRLARSIAWVANLLAFIVGLFGVGKIPKTVKPVKPLPRR